MPKYVGISYFSQFVFYELYFTAFYYVDLLVNILTVEYVQYGHKIVLHIWSRRDKHVACMVQMTNSYRRLTEKYEDNRKLWKPWHWSENNES